MAFPWCPYTFSPGFLTDFLCPYSSCFRSLRMFWVRDVIYYRLLICVLLHFVILWSLPLCSVHSHCMPSGQLLFSRTSSFCLFSLHDFALLFLLKWYCKYILLLYSSSGFLSYYIISTYVSVVTLSCIALNGNPSSMPLFASIYTTWEVIHVGAMLAHAFYIAFDLSSL